MKISIFSCLQCLGNLTMSTSQLLSLLLSQDPAKGSHPPNYVDKSVGEKKPSPKLTKLFLQQKFPPNILKKECMRKLKLKWWSPSTVTNVATQPTAKKFWWNMMLKNTRKQKLKIPSQSHQIFHFSVTNAILQGPLTTKGIFAAPCGLLYQAVLSYSWINKY